MKHFSLTLAVALALCGTAAAEELTRTPSLPGARVYVVSPPDGSTVPRTFTVRFGLSGMGVAPAGVASPGTGHHHLVLDADLPDLSQPLPTDAHHIHFGKGQTETVLELEPGTHTLQLVLGDANHVPHDPPLVSPAITVHVE